MMIRCLLQILAAGLLCVAPALAQVRPTSPKEVAELRAKAEKGDTDAQYSLGYMYANDRGTDKDEAEAYKWYLLAAAQKDEGAKKEIEKLEPTLTPAQRKEGQRRTHEFKPSQPE